MAKWLKVTAQYDHKWPSRAVTSYPPGVYFVKDEVADGAIAKGRGELTDKPESDEARAAEDSALREAEALRLAEEQAAAETANRAAVAAEEAEAKRKPKPRRVEVND